MLKRSPKMTSPYRIISTFVIAAVVSVSAEKPETTGNQNSVAEAAGEAPTQRDAKLIELSKAFWKAVTEADSEKAKKSIFVAADDATQKQGKFIEENVLEEFSSLIAYTKGREAEFKLKEVVIEKHEGEEDPVHARVTLMIWEPDEGEFEKMTTTWLNTKKSGWKLVDL